MIIFENAGEIDPRAIATMGVNVKETRNPIGYFGTGLKYAIAVLLRTGHKIEIQSGTKTFKFGVKTEAIRGVDFGIVTMNKRELGFTTQLGKNWKMWQVLRELYCNCEDELGRHYVSNVRPKPADNVTRVIVLGADFEHCYETELSSIILQSKSIEGSTHASIHPKEGNLLFFRGVRAYDLGSMAPLYTYNVQDNCELTEDRTIKHLHVAMAAVCHHVMRSENEELIFNVLTAPEGSFESRLTSFDDWNAPEPSTAFLAAIERARKDRGRKVNESAVRVLRSVRGAANSFMPWSMSEIESLVLNKSIAFCKKLRFNVDEYPIHVVETLGENILGLAEKDEIFLAKRCFDMGAKTVISTLIEEFIHLRHGYSDESRSMQNFLFDTIVSLGEEIHGEPL